MHALLSQEHVTVLCAIKLALGINIRSICTNLGTLMDTIIDLLKVERVCTLQQTLWCSMSLLS